MVRNGALDSVSKIPDSLRDFFVSREQATEFRRRRSLYMLKYLGETITGPENILDDDYALTLYQLTKYSDDIADVDELLINHTSLAKYWAGLIDTVDNAIEMESETNVSNAIEAYIVAFRPTTTSTTTNALLTIAAMVYICVVSRCYCCRCVQRTTTAADGTIFICLTFPARPSTAQLATHGRVRSNSEKGTGQLLER